MLVDTHTHFYDEWLLPDAEAAIQRALDAGVGKMIQADVDSSERPRMWEIGRRHPGVLFQMAGLYPGSVRADNWRDELDQVHGIFGRGAVSSVGPGPGSMPQNAVEGTVGGPGPRGKSGPGPGSMPQNAVEGTVGGPGPQGKSGPGPGSMPQNTVEGTVGGPGPQSKSGPGPQGKITPRSDATTQGGLGSSPSESESGFKTMLPAIVAIGEIGLDYHEGKEYMKEQKEVLRLQFELAAKLDLPVNIHLRDAWEDFFTILEDCRHLHLRGNLHCFSGSYEVYERANRSGDFSVGIGGVLTFKNASLPAVVARIPMEHILLETDAPYLAPVPYRGKRNESAYLPLIAARLAEIKQLSLSEIETITTDNATRLFAL